MNQSIIDEQIKFWTEEFPSLERYYSDKNVSGVINLLRTIEDKIPSEALMDFIDGIALYPVYLKSQDAITLKKISEQIAPAIEHLIEHLSSKSYKSFLIDQEITGEEILTLDGIKIPLSKKAIELHIKRLKATPLLPKDVAAIQADLVSYKETQFKLSGNKPRNDGFDKYRELYHKLKGEYLVGTSEENFVRVIKDKFLPTNEKIIWSTKKGKKQSAHVFSEWLDGSKDHKKTWNDCFVFEDGKKLVAGNGASKNKEHDPIGKFLRQCY